MNKSKTIKKSLNFSKALILPIVVYLIFFIGSGGVFGTKATLLNNAINTVQPILMGWGLAFVFSAGMWDMSAAAVVVVSSIMAGNITNNYNLGLIGVIVVPIIVAVVLTALTGFLTFVFNVPSMILTLGLVLIYETISTFVFGGKGTYVMGDLSILGRSPYCFYLLGAGFIVVMFLWKNTKLAYQIRAIGSNELGAKRTGIKVKRVCFTAFLIEGLFLGLSATSYLCCKGNINAVLNMASMTLMFNSMMGMFIGMSLSRYCSLPIGIMIGAFSMKMLSTGLMSFGLSSTLQDVFTGVFLLTFLSITLNQNKIFEMSEARKRAKRAKANLVNQQS